MSTQSSSPSRGGSQPDLTKLRQDEPGSSAVTFRQKRKAPVHDCCIEFSSFRQEMTTLFKDFVDSQNKFLDRISNDISAMRENIKSLQETTQNMVEENKLMKSDISELKAYHSATEEKIQKLNTNVNYLKQNTDNPSTSLSSEEILAEVQERYRRERNIIVTGITEANKETREERIAADTKTTMELIRTIYPDSPDPIQVRRLGKYAPNKTRSIKVTFSSRDQAVRILKSKQNQENSTHKIFSDQTITQQNQMKFLRSELNRRTTAGEKGLGIKYIKGVPKIVNLEPKNFTKNHVIPNETMT